MQILYQLGDYKPDLLIRADLGREMDFAVASGIFCQIHSFFSTLRQAPWDNVPISVIETCADKVRSLTRALEEVRRFSLAGKTRPEDARNSVLEKVFAEWAGCYNYMVPHAAFALLNDKAGDEVFEELRGSFDKAKKSLETDQTQLLQIAREGQEAMKASQEEAKNILDGIRATARESGVTNQAVHFKRLADVCLWTSVGWLFSAVIMGVVIYCYLSHLHLGPSDFGANGSSAAATLGISNSLQLSGVNTNLAVPSSYPSPPPKATPDAGSYIKAIIPEVLTMSLLLTGLVFCLRNYSSMSHNRIVNRHRQTALATFKTFVTSTEDKAIKDTILVQATQAIFAPRPSGYLKGENDGPQPSPIGEVVRVFSEKSEPSVR